VAARFAFGFSLPAADVLQGLDVGVDLHVGETFDVPGVDVEVVRQSGPGVE